MGNSALSGNMTRPFTPPDSLGLRTRSGAPELAA
jgi:hypothetical protein